MSQIAWPHIEICTNLDGQPRAYIAGTRVRVQDVSARSEIQGQAPDQIIQALPHLTLAQVHSALAYYFDHRDEILREMREDQQFADQLRQLRGPGPLSARSSAQRLC